MIIWIILLLYLTFVKGFIFLCNVNVFSIYIFILLQIVYVIIVYKIALSVIRGKCHDFYLTNVIIVLQYPLISYNELLSYRFCSICTLNILFKQLFPEKYKITV